MWIALSFFACLAAASAAAAQIPRTAQSEVVIFSHSGIENRAVVGRAEMLASQMLEGAGVHVEWRRGDVNYHGSAEVIELLLTEPRPGYKPGALAFAILGKDSGTRIEIFYNRLRTAGGADTVSAILGHVFVHEVTHILEGVNRHSKTGVMKADWDTEDRWRMRFQPLPFSEEDLRLIQAWSTSRGLVLAHSRTQPEEQVRSLTIVDTLQH